MFLGCCLAFVRQLRVFQVSVRFVLGLGIFFSELYSVVFKKWPRTTVFLVGRV